MPRCYQQLGRAAQRTGVQLRAAREPPWYSGGRPPLLPPNRPPAGWKPWQAPGRRRVSCSALLGGRFSRVIQSHCPPELTLGAGQLCHEATAHDDPGDDQEKRILGTSPPGSETKDEPHRGMKS